jgi:hypothetical protein
VVLRQDDINLVKNSGAEDLKRELLIRLCKRDEGSRNRTRQEDLGQAAEQPTSMVTTNNKFYSQLVEEFKVSCPSRTIIYVDGFNTEDSWLLELLKEICVNVRCGAVKDIRILLSTTGDLATETVSCLSHVRLSYSMIPQLFISLHILAYSLYSRFFFNSSTLFLHFVLCFIR